MSPKVLIGERTLPMLKKYHLLFIALLPTLFFYACEKNKPQKEVPVASVNDAPISLPEFRKEVSVLSKRDPSLKITEQTLMEEINTLIDRKILLQEAMKQGLAEDPRFVETIKIFWEQTLIRELIALKTKEWADTIFVTEEEINAHYRRMQFVPFIKLAKAETKEQAGKIKQKMAKGLPVDGEEPVGQIYPEDVRSDALLHAFDMNVGETNIFEADGKYMVVRVIKKDKASPPPLKEAYANIKKFLLEKKKQDAVEKWLKQARSASKIEINNSLLKGLAHE